MNCYRIAVLVNGRHRSWVIAAPDGDTAKERARVLAASFPTVYFEVGEPVLEHESLPTRHRSRRERYRKWSRND